MELSLLCEVKVFLCVIDKNNRKMIFSSESNANDFIDENLITPIDAHEIILHKDVFIIYSVWCYI